LPGRVGRDRVTELRYRRHSHHFRGDLNGQPRRVDGYEQRHGRGVQSAASLRGGPLHELLALVIRQAEQVRFGHRSPTVWRFFDAIEHGVICGGRHVSQSDASLHELSERVGGVRLEHSAHQLREFGRAWLVALAHVLSIPCSPNVRIFPHKGRLGESEPCGLRPDLDIDADCVMVLRNAGPVGAPGMPDQVVTTALQGSFRLEREHTGLTLAQVRFRQAANAHPGR
jgi:hypothetical protein